VPVAEREELARLPAHMRQAVICEGGAASYRLEVRHEGRLLAEQIVRGGGWRHDRRLYVFREFTLPPGDARVSVRFDRIDAPAASCHGTRQSRRPAPAAARRTSAPNAHDASCSRSRVEAVPPTSRSIALTLVPREVMLVTYDPASRALAVREAAEERRSHSENCTACTAAVLDTSPPDRRYSTRCEGQTALATSL
jgi:hypothetical protein